MILLPPGAMAISDGRALLVNLHKKVVLHHFNFKQPVRDIKYSPNGRSVQWQLPSWSNGRSSLVPRLYYFSILQAMESWAVNETMVGQCW